MADYIVQRGDSLSGICSRFGSRIAGNNNAQKVNTLARVNHIRNVNLIYVGQQINFSTNGSGGGTSSPGAPPAPPPSHTVVTITDFGLSSEDKTGRTLFIAWSWGRVSTTKHYAYEWDQFINGRWVSLNHNNTQSASEVDSYLSESASESATRIRVRIKPISEEHVVSTTQKDEFGKETTKEKNVPWYTDAQWSVYKEYDYSQNPPLPPDVSNLKVEIDKEVTSNVTCTLNNIDLTTQKVTGVKFQIIKNNEKSEVVSGVVPIRTITGTSDMAFAKYIHRVGLDGSYTVRCKYVNGAKESGWSDISSEVISRPSAPERFIRIEPRKSRIEANNEIRYDIFVEWSKVDIAKSYTLVYATSRDGLDDSFTGVGRDSITCKDNKVTIANIDKGSTYYFKVNAINANGDESDWTEYKNGVTIGSAPNPPTTWTNSQVFRVVDGYPKITLYWVHNSTDNSVETLAKIKLVINKVTIPDISVRRKQTDEPYISNYTIPKEYFTAKDNNYEIEWSVQTYGIDSTMESKPSEVRIIKAYESPGIVIGLLDGRGKPIGTGVNALTILPLYISAETTPKPNPEQPLNQYPLGYSVKIVANGYYTTTNQYGDTININDGDSVYAKYYPVSPQTGFKLNLILSADSIDLESGISYTVVCEATMSSGLNASGFVTFVPDWQEPEFKMDANITVDYDNYTAQIQPYSIGNNQHVVNADDLTPNIFFDIFRREYDGSFTLIAKHIPNDNASTVTDPHPSLDFARYRLVGRDSKTGSVLFYDLPGKEVHGTSIIIQWDEKDIMFNSQDIYSVTEPQWAGTLLELKYNIDVSENTSVESELVYYAGRSNPVAYYGDKHETSASWKTEIPAYDKETIYKLRRLSIWPGNVYVREPSGVGYWAYVKVSFSQTHLQVTIPVTINVTRVEGGK